MAVLAVVSDLPPEASASSSSSSSSLVLESVLASDDAFLAAVDLAYFCLDEEAGVAEVAELS